MRPGAHGLGPKPHTASDPILHHRPDSGLPLPLSKARPQSFQLLVTRSWPLTHALVPLLHETLQTPPPASPDRPLPFLLRSQYSPPLKLSLDSL